ncbi:MAG: TusE/DsrC/DsvC family sulfur relay protein [Bacteroidetes bacterium]|jgi:tRNA 2-thiouridine synthesizing protein E|nr:TusE/DsrC/DsvC family sulfur relay protein [Bacteroidota bacterium]MBT5529825.1 TusE/DsrC/DsvC family sulfur relay protein [Cytophagia bacterium]MBT3422655.1 TusE/DsrC/DsvC family sulfur relay protein [Bacteroidota bacterium]MBT3801400.1 TusE/DsrC/DsvC family sulfur relay protein [Bacteroidota bacterium]MBT3934860.1 TusE/DsrC/DsvC family sulfur relay protein [Bacteroidota bacterium]
MATKTIAGVAVEVTEEGYLVNPSEWTKEIAAEIAKEEEIELTDKHFEVINFIRDRNAQGITLTIRAVGKSGIVDIKGLYELFPGGPLKKSSRIAGIPKPASCV